MLILFGFLAVVLIGRGVVEFALADSWVGIITTAAGLTVFAVWFLLSALADYGIQQTQQEVPVGGA